MHATRSAEPITDPVQIPLGKHGRYRPSKKNQSKSNDSGPSSTKAGGPKTYDPKAHVYVYDAGRGKGRMRHNPPNQETE